MCSTLVLTYQDNLISANSHHVPMHDWCTFRRDMFIISGDIKHWNMDKLPMLYNGNIRCHGNICYVFRSVQVFAHSIGQVQALCVSILGRIGWILTILDDFINQPYHIDNIQNSENVQMTLTVDLYLTLTLTLTLTIWRNTLFSFFFEVTWRKNVTSYVKTDGRMQKCRSIRNILQPTGDLYHFRFKSYGPLCDFHWIY